MILGPGTDPRPRDVLPARDGACGAGPGAQLLCRWAGLIVACRGWHDHAPGLARRPGAWGPDPAGTGPGRSEEHTSELQSRGHLVCRLLLEKKKTEMGEVGT